MRLNIFQWLKKQGYDYTWNVKLGAKTPDIIAFKEKEIIAFEIKRYADEISKAIGQCLFYLQNSNKVYIVLPLKEIEKIQIPALNLMKKYGIGLIQLNKDVKVVIESKYSPLCIEEILNKLKTKSLSVSNYNRSSKNFGKRNKKFTQEASRRLIDN